MKNEDSKQSEKINKIFVYGTLRPDIKAPWTEKVYQNEKFKIIPYKAFIEFSSLQLFKYHKYANLRIDRKWLSSSDVVHGFLLESSNIDETLMLFDLIEDCPNLYNRIVTKCYNEQLNLEEEAYVYIIPNYKHIMSEAFECIHNDIKHIL